MLEKLKTVFSKKEKKQDTQEGNALNLEQNPPVPLENKPKKEDFQMPSLPSQPRGISKEEQKALLKQRKKIPIHVLVLKFVSLLSLTLLIVSWVALRADMNDKNDLLKYFGLSDNTQTTYLKAKAKEKKLKQENENYSKKIEEYTRRLKEEDYFIYAQTTDQIKANQFQWFNETIDGEYLIGIIDSLDLMKTYITQSDYENKKKYPINFILNNVTLDSKSFNRKETSVGVKVSNVSQNTLTLSTEFIEMLNSFPFFKGASISSFSRKENEEGELESSFSLKLKIQGKDEEDSADERFKEFTDWLESMQKNSQKTTTSPRRKTN